jgi:CPA1 family monovalent cation:H+ antiporter
VGALALIGTALSTLIVGYGAWYVLQALGIALPLTYCLLFGALISPTDPIAVLGVLKSANVPHSVEATIAGESLINDGVGVVLFTLLLEVLRSGAAPTFDAALALFVREALGGAVFGSAVGYAVFRVLRTIDAPQVEILITLATVVASYALARDLHVSGPLAMVAIGLLIGNEGRALAMSAQTRERLDLFWQLLDEILNGVLFVPDRPRIHADRFSSGIVHRHVLLVALCLFARYLVVGVPVKAGGHWFGLPAGSDLLLTWSGVRAGISVALALSLAPGDERNVILMLTYCVVVFSILVQGLTVGRVARRLGLNAASESVLTNGTR